MTTPAALLTSVITGVDAVLANFPTLGAVHIERSVDSEPIQLSNISGGVDHQVGNIDFEGLIRAWGFKPPSGVFPNLLFPFNFTKDGTEDVYASEVFCMGLDIVVPVHDRTRKNAIFYTVHIGAAGEDLTYANAVPTPVGSLTKYPVQNLATFLDNTPEPFCQMAHLKIEALVEKKVNSGSGGIYFRPKGGLNWTYTYNRDYAASSALPALNAVHAIKMEVQHTGPQKFWTMNYGRVIKVQEMLDKGTRAPNNATITLVKCNNGTDVGSITDPDSAAMWPTYAG